MSREIRLNLLVIGLAVLSLAACQSSSGDGAPSDPTPACEETPWDCECETSADCPGDWDCTYGKCYEPGCHYDCICGPLDCAEADHYGYSCSDCDDDIFAPDIYPDQVDSPDGVGDTGADVTLEAGPTEPEPCSPEAQGLSGTPVGHASWTLYPDCSWHFDDLDDNTAGAVVTVATSAEDFAALFDCAGDKPEGVLDYSKSRMVLIRGLAEIEPRPPNWVLEIDGVVWVDLTTQMYSSGIELVGEPYAHALSMEAGETPVQAQECVIPYEGDEMP